MYIEIIGSEALKGRRKSVEMARGSAGIYFLFDGEEVVYVGQSITPIARILVHIREGEKQFDSYAIVEVNEAELDEYEAAYIWLARPRYNANMPKSQAYKKWGDVKRMFSGTSLNGHQFNKIVRENGVSEHLGYYEWSVIRPLIRDWLDKRRRA